MELVLFLFAFPMVWGTLSDIWYKDTAENLEDKTVLPCPECDVAVEK